MPSAAFLSTKGRRFETTIKLLLTFASADVTVICMSQMLVPLDTLAIASDFFCYNNLTYCFTHSSKRVEMSSWIFYLFFHDHRIWKWYFHYSFSLPLDSPSVSTQMRLEFWVDRIVVIFEGSSRIQFTNKKIGKKQFLSPYSLTPNPSVVKESEKKKLSLAALSLVFPP